MTGPDLTQMPRLDAALLRDGIRQGNIPTLLCVLYQMTGEERWLQPPYTPGRARGLDDNDDGGLPEDIQQEIRDAAEKAIFDWIDGARLAIPHPSNATLARMLSVSMNEPVPESYGEVIASDLGLAAHSKTPETPWPSGLRVLVVGAGVSGICVGANLKRLGVDFEIIEKNEEFGGTWWENRYPGAGVDTPNHIYSFSFAPNDWSRYFALQGELLSYFRSVADRVGLREKTRFSTRVEEARWDGDSRKWVLRLRDAKGTLTTERCDILMSAVGVLNTPQVPDIPGADTFPGIRTHTAQWPEDLDVTGKHVALVGNGASGMQVAPAIADKVASLTIFARSKQWAAPFPQFQKKVPDPVRHLLMGVPLYQQWYRIRQFWTFNDRIHESLQKDPNWPEPDKALNATNDRHRRIFTKYVKSELGDRQDLLPHVLPDFPPYGKRILLDNGWYRTITRPNVELVPDRLSRIDGRRLTAANGESYEADVLIYATGFKAAEMQSSYDIVGCNGQRLADVWETDNPRAYIGSTVPGFPNFFTILGPNVGLGHGGSMIKAIELQTSYILSVITRMAEKGMSTVEVRPEVYEDYNRRIDEAHDRMVWTHQGTENWYRNRLGRVVAISPWRNDQFWLLTRDADPQDYVFGS
ncbi:NAD(P)/FAD-dependent oxidoreductase [Stappia stellulata]|uniref:flavin-containing monooxygenase n=1 Tax=Stappia stellulata TaxID=71235 RepID=UPI001CD1A310|nr:NAD(P)/FAD-dependent oxidoreductase [Stappia stellulata]MCA1243312.1 NAD(P)/FAD-dependent oxidoreductase [Stappia stellulata]